MYNINISDVKIESIQIHVIATGESYPEVYIYISL